MTDLTDKVVLVTGGSQGMGAATSRLAAQAGAKVVIADLKAEAGEAVATSIRDNGGEAAFVQADISDEAAVESMVKFAIDTFSRLDGAVNNAAMAPDDKPIAEMDQMHFDKVLAVDVKGTALCLKYEIKQMLAQGSPGAVVNISSAIALKPSNACPAYIAAKHAVIGLTKSASKDYGKSGIRVNAIAPGSVDTVMLRGFLEQLGLDPQEWANSQSTLGRFAQPEEVAQGSLWLLSDAASYAHGITLGVEGGYQDS